MSMEEDQILYLSFNQDLSCVSCGTNRGFVIYDTNPVRVRFQQNFGSGIGIAKILYNHNVVALVGGGKHPLAAPNKCLIWDDQKKKILSELEYVNCVKSVEMTRSTFAVATDDTIRVYDFGEKLKQLYKFKTGNNPLGLCELSLNDQETDDPEQISVPIVLSKTKKRGQIAIINYQDPDYAKKPQSVIDCHLNDIHKIRLNADANMFATCSELGTLIRVYRFNVKPDTDKGEEHVEKMCEFRRGTDYANVQNIYFSDDSKFLLVTSNKSTLHVYSLSGEYTNQKSALNFASGVLPRYFGDDFSFAQVTVPSENYIAGITKSKTQSKTYDINVFMYNGHFMHYVFFPDQKHNKIRLEKEGNFYEFSKLDTDETPENSGSE